MSEVEVTVTPLATIAVSVEPVEVAVVAAANVGPPGPPGQWTRMTQSQFDAIPSKDPDVLYVIIG